MKVDDFKELPGKAEETRLVAVRYFDDEKYFWTRPGWLYPRSIDITVTSPTIRLYDSLGKGDSSSQNYTEIPVKNISHIDPLVDFKNAAEVYMEYYRAKRRRDICRKVKERQRKLDLD